MAQHQVVNTIMFLVMFDVSKLTNAYFTQIREDPLSNQRFVVVEWRVIREKGVGLGVQGNFK